MSHSREKNSVLENKTQAGLAHCEAMVKQFRAAIEDKATLRSLEQTEDLFLNTMSALANIAETQAKSDAAIQSKAMATWVREIVFLAKKNKVTHLNFYSYAMKAYSLTDSPSLVDFASGLIIHADQEEKRQKPSASVHKFYFLNVIHLSSVVNATKLAMFYYEKAAQANCLTEDMGLSLLNHIEKGRLNPECLPEILLKIVDLQTNLITTSRFLYIKTLDLLIKREIFDENLSGKIIEYAKSKNKLNEKMLALHFSIALHCKVRNSDEYFALYQEMRNQTKGFNPVFVPVLYQNLLALMARSDDASLTSEKGNLSAAEKERKKSQTDLIYNHLCVLKNHVVRDSKSAEKQEEKRVILSALIQKAKDQSGYPKQESTAAKQKYSSPGLTFASAVKGVAEQPDLSSAKTNEEIKKSTENEEKEKATQQKISGVEKTEVNESVPDIKNKQVIEKVVEVKNAETTDQDSSTESNEPILIVPQVSEPILEKQNQAENISEFTKEAKSSLDNQSEKSSIVEGHDRQKGESYSDIFEWLNLSEADLKNKIDLQARFNEEIKKKLIDQHTCLRMLKFIKKYKLKGNRNFTIALFNFVSTADFLQINKPEEIVADFNKNFSILTLKALLVEDSPDLDFMQQVIQFGRKSISAAKLEEIENVSQTNLSISVTKPEAIESVSQTKPLISTTKPEAKETVSEENNFSVKDQSENQNTSSSSYHQGEKNSKFKRYNQQNGEYYPTIFDWLNISETDLKNKIDLQSRFNEIVKNQHINQHVCIRMLKFIEEYKLTGYLNFTMVLFEYASTMNFLKINQNWEILNDFYESLPVRTLKALLVDHSPDLNFIKKVVQFARVQQAKMQFIYPLAINCIAKNNTLTGEAHCEAVVQQVREAIEDQSAFKDEVPSEYLFGAAMNALANISEAYSQSDTAIKSTKMAGWIREIGKLAQKYRVNNPFIFNNAMKAYAHTDSPVIDFASKLINFALEEKEKQKRGSEACKLYFLNAIYLYSAVNQLNQAMDLYEAAAQEKCLTDSMGFSLLINIERGRLKPNSFSDILLKMLDLQAQHTKLSISLYTKTLDVLIQLEKFDENLSREIIEHANSNKKLNEIMLASYFSIALRCSTLMRDINEHIALYKEMRRQTERFKNILFNPMLYQNLMALMARSRAQYSNAKKGKMSEAQQKIKIMQDELYSDFLKDLNRHVANETALSAEEKQNKIDTLTAKLQEVRDQTFSPKQESALIQKKYFSFASALKGVEEQPNILSAEKNEEIKKSTENEEKEKATQQKTSEIEKPEVIEAVPVIENKPDIEEIVGKHNIETITKDSTVEPNESASNSLQVAEPIVEKQIQTDNISQAKSISTAKSEEIENVSEFTKETEPSLDNQSEKNSNVERQDLQNGESYSDIFEWLKVPEADLKNKIDLQARFKEEVKKKPVNQQTCLRMLKFIKEFSLTGHHNFTIALFDYASTKFENSKSNKYLSRPTLKALVVDDSPDLDFIKNVIQFARDQCARDQCAQMKFIYPLAIACIAKNKTLKGEAHCQAVAQLIRDAVNDNKFSQAILRTKHLFWAAMNAFAKISEAQSESGTAIQSATMAEWIKEVMTLAQDSKVVHSVLLNNAMKAYAHTNSPDGEFAEQLIKSAQEEKNKNKHKTGTEAHLFYFSNAIALSGSINNVTQAMDFYEAAVKEKCLTNFMGFSLLNNIKKGRLKPKPLSNFLIKILNLQENNPSLDARLYSETLGVLIELKMFDETLSKTIIESAKRNSKLNEMMMVTHFEIVLNSSAPTQDIHKYFDLYKDMKKQAERKEKNLNTQTEIEEMCKEMVSEFSTVLNNHMMNDATLSPIEKQTKIEKLTAQLQEAMKQTFSPQKKSTAIKEKYVSEKLTFSNVVKGEVTQPAVSSTTEKNSNVERLDQRNGEPYSDIFGWLAISKADLDKDIDLQTRFKEEAEKKDITQHTCIRMLKFIEKYRLTGHQNFTLALFDFASITNFLEINKPEEILADFNESFPVLALKALLIDHSPDLDCIKRVIQFARNQHAKMHFIYPLAIMCLAKNNTLTGVAHCEAVVQQVRDAIHGNPASQALVCTKYLFGSAMNALANISETQSKFGTAIKSEEMQVWVNEIERLAQENKVVHLYLYANAIKAYAHTDSPSGNFALELIDIARIEKGKEKPDRKSSKLYFLNAIYLSGVVNELTQAMTLYRNAAQEDYLTTAMALSLLSNIKIGRLKPESPSEVLFEIFDLQEKHANIDIRLYGETFDVLIKRKIFDEILSQKIIRCAQLRNKLNESMLASHFEIALHCSVQNQKIDDYLKLYKEVKIQSKDLPDQLAVPNLEHNLFSLMMRFDAHHFPSEQIRSQSPAMKEFLTLLTADFYDSLEGSYNRLMHSSDISFTEKKKNLSFIRCVFQYGMAKGYFPDQENNLMNQEYFPGRATSASVVEVMPDQPDLSGAANFSKNEAKEKTTQQKTAEVEKLVEPILKNQSHKENAFGLEDENKLSQAKSNSISKLETEKESEIQVKTQSTEASIIDSPAPIQWINKERVSPSEMTTGREILEALQTFNAQECKGENPDDLKQHIHELKKQVKLLLEHEYLKPKWVEPFALAYIKCALAYAEQGLSSVNLSLTRQSLDWEVLRTVDWVVDLLVVKTKTQIEKEAADRIMDSLNSVCFYLQIRFLKKISHFSPLSKIINLFLNHFQKEEYPVLMQSLSKLFKDMKSQAREEIITYLQEQSRIFREFLDSIQKLLPKLSSTSFGYKGLALGNEQKQMERYGRNEFLYNTLIPSKKFIEDICQILKSDQKQEVSALGFYQSCSSENLWGKPDLGIGAIKPSKVKNTNISFNFDSVIIKREEIFSFCHLLSRIFYIDYTKPGEADDTKFLNGFLLSLLKQMEKAFSDALQSGGKISALETHLASQFYFHCLTIEGFLEGSCYFKQIVNYFTKDSQNTIPERLAFQLSIPLNDAMFGPSQNPMMSEEQEYFYKMSQFIKESKTYMMKLSSEKNQNATPYFLSLTFPVRGRLFKRLFDYFPNSGIFKIEKFDDFLSETRLDHIQKNMKQLNEYKRNLNQLIHFYEMFHKVLQCFLDHASFFMFLDEQVSIAELKQRVSDCLPKRMKELELEKMSFNKKKAVLDQKLAGANDLIAKREKLNKLWLEKLKSQVQKAQKQIPKLKAEEVLGPQIQGLFSEKELSAKPKKWLELALDKLVRFDYHGASLYYQLLSNQRDQYLQGQDGMLFCEFKILMQAISSAHEEFEVFIQAPGNLNQNKIDEFNALLLNFNNRLDKFSNQSNRFKEKLNQEKEAVSSETISLFSMDERKQQIEASIEFMLDYHNQLAKALDAFKALKAEIDQAASHQSDLKKPVSQGALTASSTSNASNSNKAGSNSKQTKKSAKNNKQMKGREKIDKDDVPVLPSVSIEVERSIHLSMIEPGHDQSKLFLLMEGALACFDNPNVNREEQKQLLLKFVRMEEAHHCMQWDESNYSRLYQFLIEYFIVDHDIENRYRLLFQIEFIQRLVFKTTELVNEIHPVILKTLHKIQSQIQKVEDRTQLNKALILAHILSAMVSCSMDPEIIRHYSSSPEGIDSPLFLVSQIAKVTPDCELYFYLLLSANVSPIQNDSALDSRLQGMREKILAHNRKVFDEVNIHTPPHFLFSFEIDALSRVFNVKLPSQIFIKTSLSSDEFGFETSSAIFTDSGNAVRDLIYISKSKIKDQMPDLYLMVKDSEVFEDIIGMHFTVDQILFDYLSMKPRYGTFQSRQDAELKKLNWIMDENQAHKNMSNHLNYIFYAIRLSLPFSQASFQSLKSSITRFISENIKKKNQCIPAGVVSKEEINLFLSRSLHGNFSDYYQYLAESGLLFVILPLPLSLYPILAVQIDGMIKKLNGMDLRLDDPVQGLADRMAFILHDSIYLSGVTQVNDLIGKIKEQLKNYLPQNLAEKIVYALNLMLAKHSASTANLSVSVIPVSMFTHNAPQSNAPTNTAANIELKNTVENTLG